MCSRSSGPERRPPCPTAAAPRRRLRRPERPRTATSSRLRCLRPAANPTTSTTTTAPTTTTVTTTTTTTPTTPTTPAGHTSLTVTGVRLNSSWKNSRLTGKVRFSVTVRGPSRLTALIRGAGGGRVRAERHYSTRRAGTFSETLRLSPRTPPGALVLRVLATTGSASQAVRETRLELKPPPEGIIDFASISLVKGGRGASTFASPQKGALGPVPLRGQARGRSDRPGRLADTELQARRRSVQAGHHDARLVVALRRAARPGQVVRDPEREGHGGEADRRPDHIAVTG